MKRQQTLTIILTLIGLLVIACAPTRQQDSTLEPAATVDPVETLVVERPSATPTAFPTVTPWLTVTPWQTATPFPAEIDDIIPDVPRLIHTPADSKSNDRYPTFTLTFDRVMNQATVEEALYVWPETPLNVIWVDETTLEVTVVEALVPNLSYNFMVQQTAVDQEETSLTKDYRWSYSLEPLLNKITWPNVNTYNDPITLVFNYTLDPTSLALQLEPATTGELIGDEPQTTFQFVPDTPLTGHTHYTLTFGEGLTDAQGQPLPQPDTVRKMSAPIISDVSPKLDSTVHPANTIQITFNRPMDEESTKAAFQIEPRMLGTLEWHDNTLEIHPLNDRLAAEAIFNVTVTTDALDVNGFPILSQDYTWSFQTGAMTDRANFGDGEKVQVLSLNGRRAIQFGYPSELFPANFRLHRLDSDDWLTTGSLKGSELVATWQEEPASYLNDYMRIQETILPGDLAAGLYVLDIAVQDTVEDQLVLVLTNHVLTVHEDGTKTAVWLTSLDGQTAANAEIRILTQNGSLLHRGLTDESGLFTVETAVPPDAKIVAQIGHDFAYSGLGGWSNNIAPSITPYNLHLYTNRPIYHPSQTVYYRVIMRQNANGDPVMLPAGTPIQVDVRNQEGTILHMADLSSSHFGTAFGEFALANSLAAGNYSLSIEVDGQRTSQHFEVAPTPGEYIVTVTTDKTMYIQGERIHITVDAHSREGQPLAHADVRFKLYETGEAYSCFGTPAFNDEWYDSYRDELTRHTDENGRATFTTTADLGYNSHLGVPNSNNYHAVWALNAIVSTGQESSVDGFTVVEVSNTAETVTMDFGSRLQQVGQSFTIEGQVLTLDGAPVNGRSLFLGLFDPEIGNRNANTAKQGQQIVTGADGRFYTTFTINQPGLYNLYLMGQDAAGHEIFAYSDIYADHPTLASDFGDLSDYDILLTADRDSYLPGDTAHLLIRSGEDGPALLSFIRGGLHRQQVVQLTSPFTTVAVPITADDVPNLSVTLQSWDDYYYHFDPEAYYTSNSVPDSRLHSTSLDLLVKDPTAVANVTITPDKTDYAPGETAVFTMRVTNHKGEPISAELSLSLVDEALYSQYAAHTAPLQDAMYSQRISQVQSYDSMRPTRHFPYSGEFGGCGCGGWWGELAELTTDFSDTAVWYPSLVTDYNGEATITLTMPATPGEWRLTARAVTADTQVSETITTVMIQ